MLKHISELKLLMHLKNNSNRSRVNFECTSFFLNEIFVLCIFMRSYCINRIGKICLLELHEPINSPDINFGLQMGRDHASSEIFHKFPFKLKSGFLFTQHFKGDFILDTC